MYNVCLQHPIPSIISKPNLSIWEQWSDHWDLAAFIVFYKLYRSTVITRPSQDIKRSHYRGWTLNFFLYLFIIHSSYSLHFFLFFKSIWYNANMIRFIENINDWWTHFLGKGVCICRKRNCISAYANSFPLSFTKVMILLHLFLATYLLQG